jgi:thiamine transport system permease protein
VIGTGLFILLFPFADPFALALPVTALVNALMSLPFLLRALLPAVAETRGALRPAGRQPRAPPPGAPAPRLLCRASGGRSASPRALPRRCRWAISASWHPLRPAGRGTLPLQLYRLMGAYRMEDAAGAALLLLILSLALFWVFDRGGRADARA